MKDKTTRLLSVISVMMMLSMAFIGVSFLTDNEDSSALDSGSGIQTYIAEYYSVNTDITLAPIISSSAPIAFTSTGIGPEIMESTNSDSYTTMYSTLTKNSNDRYILNVSGDLYQLSTDNTYLDFAFYIPNQIQYHYSGSGGISSTYAQYTAYLNGTQFNSGNFPTCNISNSSTSEIYGTLGTLLTASIPTSLITSDTFTLKFDVHTQSMLPVANIEYTVHILSHTVSFDANGGSTTPSSQTIRQGYTATQPTAPTKANNTFDGWYYNGSLFDFSTPITSTRTLTAHWTLNAWTVTYDTDGGNTINSDQIIKGSSYNLPTPTRSGYNFTGWYSGTTLIGTGGTSYTPSADITLKASWEQVLSISSTPSTTSVIKGSTWTYTPTVNTTGYTLSLSSNAPSWLSVNGSSIQGTPGSSVTAGTYTFTMFCQKTGCQTAEQSITLTVVSSLVISNPTVYIIAYEG